jgi:carboxyl-terminal processing protease
MSTKSSKLFYGSVGIIVLALVFVFGFYIGKNPTLASKLSSGNDPEIISGLSDLKRMQSKTITVPTNSTLYQEIGGLLDEKFPFKEKIPTDAEKLYGAIEGMVSSYHDSYITFFPSKESKMFTDEVKGSFGGIGMEVGVRNDLITVIAPLKDSPAEKAGIKAGDIILKINTESTEGMDIDTAILKIRGDKDTSVTLTIAREGGSEPLEITVTRDIIKVPTLETKVLNNKVFDIEFYSFSENSNIEFSKALKKFNDSQYSDLIVDLRNNPGGYLDSAIDIASEFLPAGSVVVKEDTGSDTEATIHRSTGRTTITKPYRLVVLVNGGSASASEILSGALMENNRALLIGTKTFGKGSVQELINFNDGSSLKVTVARWLTPSGKSISEEGVHPAIELKKSPEIDKMIKEKKDPYVETALASFGKAPLNQPNK